MRVVQTSVITENIKEMCIEAIHYLSEDMKKVFDQAVENEEAPLGRQILNQLKENLQIAAEDMIPICQDTGMAVIFMEIGQDVHFEGGILEDAINEGVRQGYIEGFLRKSVVRDPLIRENTKDNTPAVIHYEIVSGDQVKIIVAPKGFGSENMSAMYMLKPAQGVDGIIDAIVQTVANAGSRPCPPVYVGVGIGGTFDTCAFLAKKALAREVGSHSDREDIAEIERIALERINALDIGCQGFHGNTTAIGVSCEWAYTHIAGLPVAVNIQCHCVRCRRAVI